MRSLFDLGSRQEIVGIGVSAGGHILSGVAAKSASTPLRDCWKWVVLIASAFHHWSYPALVDPARTASAHILVHAHSLDELSRLDAHTIGAGACFVADHASALDCMVRPNSLALATSERKHSATVRIRNAAGQRTRGVLKFGFTFFWAPTILSSLVLWGSDGRCLGLLEGLR